MGSLTQLGFRWEGAEPLLLALAGCLHVHLGIHAADDRTNGNGDDVRQLMPLATVDPRVIQSPRTINYRCVLPLSHCSATHPNNPGFLFLASITAAVYVVG